LETQEKRAHTKNLANKTIKKNEEKTPNRDCKSKK
jgi:hypothetical protein